MKNSFFALPVLTGMLLLCGCRNNNDLASESVVSHNHFSLSSLPETPSPAGNIVYRFAFVGCNRVDRNDTSQVRIAESDPSTANTEVLKRSLTEISNLSPKPNSFFFLGDMVVGETSTTALNGQLKYWTRNLQDPAYTNFLQSNIQMVAIPGNHELLTYTCSAEYPLKGSINVWDKYITAPTFIPASRNDLGSANFTFTHPIGNSGKKVGFVVMNTDTYYNTNPSNPCDGQQSYIPFQDLLNATIQLKNDPDVQYIFALGHKPCAVDGQFSSGHDYIQNSQEVFEAFDSLGVIAMLSAHKHYYSRCNIQPYKMEQIIAGNGGSPLEYPGNTYGYTVIDILDNGDVTLTSLGYPPNAQSYYAKPTGKTNTIDSAVLYCPQIKNLKWKHTCYHGE